MKLISWNVNGLRACMGKGFLEFVAQQQPDMLCLQETKMQQGQADVPLEGGYHEYWNSAEKKGYSGVALFTKQQPQSVTLGLGIDEHDHEGRVITADYGEFYLVTVYTPNAQDGLKRLDYRMAWEDAFRDYLCRLDKEKPVIVCGDMNVAHKEIDLKNPKTNTGNAGFTPQERRLLGRGARQDDRAAERRLHGYLPSFLPRPRGRVFVVELPFSRAREERRMAYRLFSCFEPLHRPRQERVHPERGVRFGPLPGDDRN